MECECGVKCRFALGVGLWSSRKLGLQTKRQNRLGADPRFGKCSQENFRIYRLYSLKFHLAGGVLSKYCRRYGCYQVKVREVAYTPHGFIKLLELTPGSEDVHKKTFAYIEDRVDMVL